MVGNDVSVATHAAMVGAECRRLVIVQWLNCGDPEEGERLCNQLTDECMPNELLSFYPCWTKECFLQTIKSVTASVATLGVPMLHLVTHGAASGGAYQGGLGGCDPGSPHSEGFVSWAELDPLLTDLAQQSGSRNFVMMTGCETYDFVKYWTNHPTRLGNEAGHFLVGHYCAVTDSIDVRLASAQFYRVLRTDGHTLLDGLAAANQWNDHTKAKARLHIDKLCIASSRDDARTTC